MIYNFMVILVLAMSFYACTTLEKLKFWGNDEKPSEQQPVANQERKNERVEIKDPMELRYSKLWNRVDELETEVMQQKEKIRVLEKGLILGLLPEELRAEYERQGFKNNVSNLKPSPLAQEHQAPVQPKPEPKITESEQPAVTQGKEVEHSEQKPQDPNLQPTNQELSAEEEIIFRNKLIKAQEFFNSGQYGKAIAEYESLGREFPHKAKEGSHHYWVALSWMQLKEYETAKSLFEFFIKSFPQSAWMARAKLNLARTEFQLGLKERALAIYKDIIDNHPKEDAAEMAKLEIKNMEKAL